MRSKMKRLTIIQAMTLVAFVANAQSCPDDNHPHAIDLGLPSGTRWACCNVGATTPEGEGGYYAWGETEEKEIYDWTTYIHCDGSSETCHDIGPNIAGSEYDVAHVKWGGSWVMPSQIQIQELIDKCSFKETTVNGVDGGLFTGPNGGTIFMPAADIRWNGFLECLVLGGYYWSSTRSPLGNAYSFHFDLPWGGGYGDEECGHGLTVRPVMSGVSMLSNHPSWLYAGRSIDDDIYADSVVWGIEGGAEGTLNISVDGKEYIQIKRYIMIYDVDAKPSVLAARRVNFYNPEVLLREESGKVYARKDQYIEVMNVIYGVGDESLFMEECNDGEVLLYDFTLGTGDRYPCRGEVFVSKVDNVFTNDGLSRRCMFLTNGMVVIEGIGCVNSVGEFYGYQNTSAISHRESGWLVAFAHWDVEGENFQVVYRDGLTSSIAHVSDSRETVGVANVYDLQGRRVKMPQSGGLYVRDGRKFIWR